MAMESQSDWIESTLSTPFHDLPSKSDMRQLIDIYFEKVYPPLPLIARSTFMRELHKSWESDDLLQTNPIFFAALNTVLAVAVRAGAVMNVTMPPNFSFDRSWMFVSNALKVLPHLTLKPSILAIQVLAAMVRVCMTHDENDYC